MELGEKLDSYAKIRGNMDRCEMKMLDAIKMDIEKRFSQPNVALLHIGVAGFGITKDQADKWLEMTKEAFPNADVYYDELPESIGTHTGPGIKAKGREGQRNLAFIMNLVGYGIALAWAILTNVRKELLLICLTYFLSVVFLSICNKGFHFRASGHASSFTGPLILMIYFIGWKVIIPALIIAALIIWSSICLKRHTIKELAGGILVNIIAFIFSVIIVTTL